MATNPFLDLHVISDRHGNFAPSDADAWTLAECAECGGSQMGIIAFDRAAEHRWLWCINCRLALVENYGVVSPNIKPLRIPAGVHGVELAAWKEVRACLAMGASTAAVMMCRKLLFHVAAANGLPEKDSKGRAPSFVEAVQHLIDEGLITPRMRPWVDRIKDVGNDANHEIAPVNAEVALDVATFTEQLLRLAYEMDALMTRETDPELT